MKLLNWIEKEDDNQELLPFCHTTRWKFFEKILEQDTLSVEFSKFPDPNPRNEKSDKVIYFFMGCHFIFMKREMAKR